MKKRFLLLALLAVGIGGLSAQNLLPDTVFTAEGRRGGTLAAWRQEGFGPGSSCQLDESVRFAGSATVRITAPSSATKVWNMVCHDVPELRANTPYTFSAWVKVDQLEKGSLAYVSLNCFAAKTRLAANDSQLHLSAAGDWRRIVQTIPALPKGTQRIRFVVCLFGHGTIHFASPQVECGKVATDYAPSPSEQEQLARRARAAETAQTWLASRGISGPSNEGRIGVLDMGLEPGPGEWGCPSDPAVFEKALGSTYPVIRVPAEALSNPHIFSRKIFDVMIVPTGTAFPMDAAENLVDYLAEGGSLLTCGGYAFDRPVCPGKTGWVDPRSSLPPPLAGTEPIALPSADHWSKGANVGGGETIVKAVAGPTGTPGIELSTPQLGMYNTAGTPFPSHKIAAFGVVSFWARTSAGTKAAWFELNEADGSRWRHRVELTPEWREYHVTPLDFKYHSDSPSVGRGRLGDRLHFNRVAYINLGVAIDATDAGKPQSFALADVRIGIDPDAEIRLRKVPQINTRTGFIRDAIHPDPEQIQTFDACAQLLKVAETKTDPAQNGILPVLAFPDVLQGYSAIGQLGVNGHGFGPNRCCWRPLLDCLSADGEVRGYAGAFLRNYSGLFAGSSWAIFGVTNQNLFAEGSPLVPNFLQATVAQLVKRLHLCETTPGYSCYRVGETALLKTRVANFGLAARDVEVAFTLTDEAGKTVASFKKSVPAKAGGLTDVEVPWSVPATAPDYVEITAELRDKSGLVDRETAAMVVWTPSVIAKGPKVRKEGLRLTLDGVSHFYTGAQTFWGQHGSVTARSPRRFRDDFRQMKEFGLRWTRCFLPCRTEEEFRDSDAIVQLAQKYGIALYHTPNLFNTPDSAVLADETKRMTAICKRYQDVPGFAIDICNEPVMKMDAPVFKKALGAEPKFGGPADDPDVYRTYRAATDFQRTWAKTLTETAHAVRPGTALAVGWSDGWAGGKALKDPQVASLDLDFTDRHYYGPWVKFTRNVKDIDLRALGKPFIVGECGAKNHPTFQKEDPWGMKDDDAVYDTRFRYLYSHAFGNGATALLSWHWRDPMEGQFPCGLVMPTGVPRPTAYTVKKMIAAFGKLELVDNPPEVVVLMDEHVRHTSARRKAIDAAWAVDDALMWWGANWSKLTSSREKDIPATVKLVIRPEGMEPSTLRETVGSLLREKGVAFTRRPQDPDTLETFRVPGKGATGWVFWNGGDHPATVERGGARVTVGASRVGYLQIRDDGQVEVNEEL